MPPITCPNMEYHPLPLNPDSKMTSFLNVISAIAEAFLEIIRQLREFLFSPFAFWDGPKGQGVDSPDRSCKNLAPGICSLKLG